MIVSSFIFFLLIFVGIGILSVTKRKHTEKDYLLAGQDVKPWLVALSAVATNYSGYMFIGMIGYTYMVGLASIWLWICWVIGDFIGSILIHKKLRVAADKCNSLTFAGTLAGWHGADYKILRVVGGLVTLIFLGTYAAAQFNAGSKALHSLFGWDYSTGAIVGSVLVLLYCWAGGIRASIWTDAAQSFVMIISMSLLFYIALTSIGGIAPFITKLHAVSPAYMDFFPSDLMFGPYFGPLAFILGWLFGGFGVVGQPHVMVRFMAMDNPLNMTRVRIYYYTWSFLFYGITFGTGLAARILLPEVDNFDAELALPTLAQQLLPDVLVGLTLAGLFAATMSTADSQVLSCSSAITRDLIPGRYQSYLATKMATVVVTAIALSIALSGNESVFQLVLIAWSALSCTFAPLLIVYALGGRPSEKLILLMMVTGVVAMLLWRSLGLNGTMYEIAPGIMAGLLVFIIQRLFLSRKTDRPFVS